MYINSWFLVPVSHGHSPIIDFVNASRVHVSMDRSKCTARAFDVSADMRLYMGIRSLTNLMTVHTLFLDFYLYCV